MFQEYSMYPRVSDDEGFRFPFNPGSRTFLEYAQASGFQPHTLILPQAHFSFSS